MNKIKAILFDFDGVMVDSIAVAFEIYKELCDHFNQEHFKSFEEFRHEHRKTHHEIYDRWGLTDEQRAKGTQIYFNATMKNKNKIQLIPKVKEMIIELSKHYKLGMLTMSSTKHVEERLTDFGIRQYFDNIITADDVVNHRPAPDAMNLAFERFGLTKEQILYVGDMRNDIQFAKATGVRNAIIHGYSWNNKDELAELNPEFFFETTSDILTILPKVQNE